MRYLTEKTVCNRLLLTETELFNLTGAGKIKQAQLENGRWYYPEDEVVLYEEQEEVRQCAYAKSLEAKTEKSPSPQPETAPPNPQYLSYLALMLR
jgi:predicted site-specific integrase-resolvase